MCRTYQMKVKSFCPWAEIRKISMSKEKSGFHTCIVWSCGFSALHDTSVELSICSRLFRNPSSD